MPARNLKSYIAVVAAAAAVGFAAAAPVSALAAAGGDAGKAPVQDFHLTLTMSDDPHAFFDDGAQPAVLCATAIEYGLIAAL